MPRLELLAFRYRDPVTGKWIGAGPGTHRPIKDPPKNPQPVPQKDPPKRDPPVKEPPDEDPATLDGLERFLLLVFLRRYVAYCARRRRFAAMNGAARLYVDVRAPFGESIAEK